MSKKNLNVQEIVDCATTMSKDEMMLDMTWQELMKNVIARNPNEDE